MNQKFVVRVLPTLLAVIGRCISSYSCTSANILSQIREVVRCWSSSARQRTSSWQLFVDESCCCRFHSLVRWECEARTQPTSGWSSQSAQDTHDNPITSLARTHEFPAAASLNHSLRNLSNKFISRVGPALQAHCVLVSYYPNTMGAYTTYEDSMLTSAHCIHLQLYLQQHRRSNKSRSGSW